MQVIAIFTALFGLAAAMPGGYHHHEAAAPAYASFAAAPAYTVQAAAAPEPVPIIQQDANVNDDGSYKFNYMSGDHSQRQEHADNYNYVKGSYSYISPEGQTVDVHYTAGQDGFQAYGDALPVPVENHYPFEMTIGAPKYSAPAPQYHAPAPQYHAPAPQYHAPAPQYHAPAPQYHAPAPQYAAPAAAPQYAAPAAAPQYAAPAAAPPKGY